MCFYPHTVGNKCEMCQAQLASTIRRTDIQTAVEFPLAEEFLYDKMAVESILRRFSTGVV